MTARATARYNGSVMASEINDKGGKRIQRVGRFEIVARIATGGMGTVYKAIDPLEDKVVALKVMSPELAKKRKMLTRFKREAMAAAKLRHKNIVAIHEFGEADGMFFLALEFVDGKDLHDYITRSPGGRLGVEEARHITLQAAHALDHAYQAGIVHRDIKPSNFLIVQQPDMPLVKLTDLGLARHEDDDEHRVTKIGTTLGTVDYMAPEQARDSSKADIRSDLYALGCTLFHMLTGKPPFPKGTMAEKLVLHMEAEPPDLCKINEAVPKSLGWIVRRMLAKDPRDRYQTPAELLEDLKNPDGVRAIHEAAPERKPRKTPERVVQEPPVPAKKSDSAASPRKKARQRKSPAWLPLAIGGSVVALLAVVAVLVLIGRRPPEEKKPPDDVKIPIIKTEPPVKPPPAPVIVGPPAPELKQLYEPILPLEPAALAKEFYGPFDAFPAPGAAQVIVVSRMPITGVSSVRTLSEALAQSMAQRAAVIEIRDQGPHYLTSQPVVEQRNLWIRGGAGIRPLLAWRVGDSSNLLVLKRGNLTLENLDVAVLPPEDAALQPATICQVQGGDLQARDCTFSVAGPRPAGVIALSLVGNEPAAGAALGAGQDPALEAKCRISRCFARGDDLTLVATDNRAAELLIDGSLAVGGAQPLVRFRNRPEDALTLRVIRSTLAARQQLLRWQSTTEQGGTPRLKILAWDVLFACTDAAATEGDLLHMADRARTSLMGIKAVNCLYAGWRQLLVAGDKTCDSLAAWRDAWGHREGDRVAADAWPPRALGILDETLAVKLLPFQTPAAFAATADHGPLGCEIGRLPPEPWQWKQRTFEKYPVAEVTLPDAESPEIPIVADGLYHGERIELGKINDLGSHLQARLQTSKVGSRVVLRLAGKGAHRTSPLRLRGVEQIVIVFEQTPAGVNDKSEPLTLELKSGGAAANALIDVEGGSLEIQRGRIRYENSRIAALPPHMIRVRGGDLRLNRCTLLGPLSKAPDSFQSLIACEGAGCGAAQPVQVALRECVLQCGKTIVELRNSSTRLRCRGSVLYSLGDVVAVELGALLTSRPDIVTSFENNTIAHRGAFLGLRCFEAPAHCQPVIVQTQANYFLDPFADEPRQACLVELSSENLARGLFLWQGKGNVFARDRLQAYYAAADMPVVKQSLKEWEQLLGPHGEVAALQADAIASKGFTPDQPPYDRLMLPLRVRVEPLPGADLAKLGLVKKK